MKLLKKLLTSVMALALVLCMAGNVPVMAQEVSPQEVETQAITTIPSGYTLVATYSRKPQTYVIGTTTVKSSSTFQLYLPKNGGKDWIQGTVKFTPVTSGAASGSFDFTNMSGEYKTFKLSTLTSGATYRITVYAYAFGTSNEATAYYKMNY